MSLSGQQSAAVAEPGPAILVAGPGSGKTTTSIFKFLHILASNPRHKVVGVTFTREGAKEMAHRLQKRAKPDQAKRALLGTFHSLTFDQLKKHKLLKKLATPVESTRFLDRVKSMAPADDQENLGHLFEEIKCSFEPHPRSQEAWFLAYEGLLHRHGVIDFYDAMRDAVVMLKDGRLPPLDCTHMIVDEAQDCDRVQIEWVAAHAERGVIVTLVGDDDQTIYEWRRALGYQGMMECATRFSAKIMPLHENYRSRSRIVQTADRLIRHNPARVPKDFIIRRPEGGEIEVFHEGDTQSLAEQVARRLGQHTVEMEQYKETRMPLGFPSETFAVLARANRDLHFVQRALSARGIRHYRSGTTMFDFPIVQNFFALLTAAADPEHGSRPLDAALHQLGITEPGIAAVMKVRAPADSESIALWLESGAAKGEGTEADTRLIKSLHERMRGWRGLLASDNASKTMLAILGARDWVLQNWPSKSDKARDLDRNNLNGATETLTKYRGPLLDRINTLSADRKNKQPGHAAALLTLHGSKGQEFDDVTLFRMDQSVIPGDSGQQDSERRLFYVGWTRAKERLRVGHTVNCPSIFIGEALGG